MSRRYEHSDGYLELDSSRGKCRPKCAGRLIFEMDNELTGQLRKIYARRFDAQREYRNRVWKVLVTDFFQQFVKPEDAILDLGCGYGQFINHIHAARKYAMDLNPQSRETLASGITFFERDCSEPWPLSSHTLDVVFSSNFFE